MEPKNFPVLLFFTLLSTGSGWRDCSLQLDQNVPLSTFPSCNATSYDCSQITCSLPRGFCQEVIKLSLDIGQWQKPMTADVTVSVPELEYDWSATLTDGEKIEVPGFPLEIEKFAIGELDVYLQCSLKKENGTIDFKVDLLATTEFEATLFNSTLIAGRFPETPKPKLIACGWREFNDLSLATKMVISTGVITFMILVLLATVFCCKRSRTATADQVKVKPPSYDEATSTKTKVPMQPLINKL